MWVDESFLFGAGWWWVESGMDECRGAVCVELEDIEDA